MALVVYKSVTGESYSFPVTVSQVKYRITINPAYSTTNTGIQSAIESHALFTSMRIVKSGNYATNLKAITSDDVDGLAIATSSIKTAGTTYVVGDVMTFASAGSGRAAAIKVTAVAAVTGAVTAYEVIDPGTKMTVGDKAIVSSTSAAGTNFALTIATVTPTKVYPTVSPFVYTQFALVTNFTQAKEVLRAEPYNVHHMKLKTPEAVMAQAKQHSVEFPNWVV